MGVLQTRGGWPDLLSSSDEGKIVLFVFAVVALLAVARWAGRISESQIQHEIPQFAPDYTMLPSTASVLDDPDAIVRSFPEDPALGPIRILRFYFLKFDALKGPPEPDAFADELIVRLTDSNTGYIWEQNYYVTTPRGLEEILKSKAWSYLYTPSVIVVARYDLETIRQAVVERIVADHEHAPLEERNGQREEML